MTGGHALVGVVAQLFPVYDYQIDTQDPSPVLQERHSTDLSTITSDNTDPEHWHIVAQDRAAWMSTIWIEAPITPQ